MIGLRMLIIRCRVGWKGKEGVEKCWDRAGQRRGETIAISPTWLNVQNKFQGKVRLKRARLGKKRRGTWVRGRGKELQLQLQSQLQLQMVDCCTCWSSKFEKYNYYFYYNYNHGHNFKTRSCRVLGIPLYGSLKERQWHCLSNLALFATWLDWHSDFQGKVRRKGGDKKWVGEQLGGVGELGGEEELRGRAARQRSAELQSLENCSTCEVQNLENWC